MAVRNTSKIRGTYGDSESYRPLVGYIRDWLKDIPIDGAFAYTSTLYQFLKVDENVSEWERLDVYGAQKNYRHFLNRVNSKVHGRHFRKRGEFVSVIPVLECANGWHYHSVMFTPDGWSFPSYSDLILDCWGKTKFGQTKQKKITRKIDGGWIGYITKFTNYRDQIDFENMKLPHG